MNLFRHNVQSNVVNEKCESRLSGRSEEGKLSRGEGRGATHVVTQLFDHTDTGPTYSL